MRWTARAPCVSAPSQSGEDGYVDKRCESRTELLAGSHFSIWTGRWCATRTRIAMCCEGRGRGHPFVAATRSIRSRTRRRAGHAGSRFLCPRPRASAHRYSGALYRAGMADGVSAGLAASGAPGFFSHSFRRCVAAHPRLANESGADMMARPEARGAHGSGAVDLMIAVIERFTPWRSFPASIRK